MLKYQSLAVSIFLIGERMARALSGVRFPAFRSISPYRQDAAAIGANWEIICIFVKIIFMKLLKLYSFVVFLTFFQSCMITESLLIKDDGSGKFSYDIDASPVMEMVGNSFSNESEKKASKRKSKKGEQRKGKTIDSTYTFKELFADKKDSIAALPAEEQERIKKMEHFSVRMIVNEEANQMKYSLFSDFKTIEELKNMTSPLTTLKSAGVAPAQAGVAMTQKEAQENSVTSYDYNGKIFKRVVAELETSEKISDSVKSAESKLSEEELEAQKLAEGLTAAMKELMGKSSYKVVYTFEKKVKNISVPNAVLSEDKKTVTIDYLFEDYMKKPKSLDLEIEFE